MISATFEVEDPATLAVIDHVPDATVEQATAALGRAHQAFPTWASLAPRRRSEVLRTAFDLMLRDKDRLAALIAHENGKSLADAAAEVAYAAEFFRWFSEEAVRPAGEFGEAPAGGARSVVHHKPAGVAALVTPWNFPAAMATRKIAPALAAGCTAVLKPAAETPLTALAIADLLREAGLPDGVLEIVPTTAAADVVSAWMGDARVRKISFTGSTAVGRILLAQAADRVVNASMELGGNAPLVVTEDADLDTAVTGAMIAKFRNGGQACTAANRIYVHDAIAEEFIARFGAEVEKLTVGPAADGSAIGPMISKAAAERIAAVVEDAVRQGARISHQARMPEAPGHFFAPTVLVDVKPDNSILAQEIFGPVAPSSRTPMTPTSSSRPTTPSTALLPTSSPATSAEPCALPSGSMPAWLVSTEVSSPTRPPRSGA